MHADVLRVIRSDITDCSGRKHKAVFTCRPRLITLDVSHSVRMRVVTGEKRVMTQCTKTSAARGQPRARFRGEQRRVGFAATPLTRRYLAYRWHMRERHLKQQEKTPTSASLRTADINIHTLWQKQMKTAIKDLNFTSQHVIFENNNNWSRSSTLYLSKQPSASNCTDVFWLCCQETWTKQETMAPARDGWTVLSAAFIREVILFQGN